MKSFKTIARLGLIGLIGLSGCRDDSRPREKQRGLHVEAVITYGDGSNFKGYQALELTRLPGEREWLSALEIYVVPKGEYKAGQVLEEVPADAVPADKFFKLQNSTRL